MKGRYILVLVALAIVGLVWVARGESAAYDACVKAGKQSNDTCRAYTH